VSTTDTRSPTRRRRSFLSLSDLSLDEHRTLLARARELKALRARCQPVTTLAGRTLLLLFEKHSTRTRVSFEAAIQQLGGGSVTLPLQDSQLSRGELFIVMTGGMAGIAGTVLVLYATILGPVIPDAAGHIVVSNSRNHRMDALVPLLIPEVNQEHLGLLPVQKKKEGWRGEIVTNPNCAVVALAMALAALLPFRPKRAVVTTLQSISGAGYPGVPSLDVTANVIPHIEGEEEKIDPETRKILGKFAAGKIEPHGVTISATTTRVPVVYGHTESVSVELGEKTSREEILEAFREFSGPPQKLELPSAPAQPIVYLDAPDRPQPRLDSERGGGMVVFIGRLRPCQVLGHKFVALGHNTIRGAAGAAILNAELMVANKLLG